MLTAALATPEESVIFYADRGGWGGVGWGVNVHVTLMMLR